jgi:hypothetical protein
MTDQNPPQEAQRFSGRSQTPESPRPMHIPEPSNIPVLRNQMDPVFNDTATYNIPHDQSFPSYSGSNRPALDPHSEEHDAVQDFLRSAEAESSLPTEPYVPQLTETHQVPNHVNTELNNDTTNGGPTSSSLGPVVGQHTVENHAATNSYGATDPVFAQAIPQDQTDPINPAESKDTNTVMSAHEPNGGPAGVDYQSLLDTIAHSASTAPAAETLTVATTGASAAPSEPDSTTKPLPIIPGLPPKPPVQELPVDYANFQAPESASAQSLFPAPESLRNVAQQLPASAPGPTFPFLPPQPTNLAPATPTQGYTPITSERPWSPITQNIYDQFLEDERGYVTEGIWDKFPFGSRLFVGNLPSEKVTKRDLFHIFHKHGRLAQISIKQAYGFVQFLDSSDCRKALDVEQGVEIRGRKIHLEVSKPQKNTRGAGANDRSRNAARRRSRSPGMRRSSGRDHYGDSRDDGRRRDDHRRTRSPTPPRHYRSRNDYRPAGGRSPPRGYVSPRSPSYAQLPSSFPPRYDDDASLPLPRRAPQDVPDVQLLILDQSVPQVFINWVEDSFRAKGLRASTIWLSPRLPLQAVIKRQIVEGVHGLVKLLQVNSMSYKIPLQVFDRSSGASNVKFNEYVDLDINVASDIVLHARRTSQPVISPYTPTQTYGGSLPYVHPQAQQASPQQYSPHGPPDFSRAPPPVQNPYQYVPQQHYSQPPMQQQPPTPSSANSNPPNLQQLLANLRHPNEGSGAQMSPAGKGPDLGGLLSNIAARQQNYAQPNPANGAQPSPMSYAAPPAQVQGYGQQQNGQQQNSVHNIMEQLARYQR